MTEAASTTETLANFYQSTQHNIPEDSHLNINLKYVKVLKVRPDFQFKKLNKYMWKNQE
jgi:hypothetical protein